MELILDQKSIEVIRYKISEDTKNNKILNLKCYLSLDFDYRSNITKNYYDIITIEGENYNNMFVKTFYIDNDINGNGNNKGNNIYCLEFTNSEDFKNGLSIEEIFSIHEILIDTIELLKNKQIPKTYNNELQKLKFKNQDTMRLNEYGGYTMLSKDWIDLFAEWISNRKVLEIGSGIGALAYELINRYITIESIDDRSWDRFNWKESREKKWIRSTEENYLDMANKYIDCQIIIMSYPIQGESAYNLYKKIKETNPDSLIVYIGPFRNDYVTDNFINSVEIVEDEQFQKVSDKYCYWFGQPYMESKMLLLK